MFGVIVFYWEENCAMTNNQKELLELIYENDNPEQAVLTAINTIISFLEQHGSSPVPVVAVLQGQG